MGRSRSRSRRSQTHRRRRRSRLRRRGGAVSAAELAAKYREQLGHPIMDEIPPVSAPPRGRRHPKGDISAMRNRNVMHCQADYAAPQLQKCSRVIAFPKERRRCREVASEVASKISLLTNDYQNKMSKLIDRCADRDLTNDEFETCQSKFAEATNEYVAQCSTLANTMDVQFGRKTLGARVEAVKQAGRKVLEHLPKYKAQRQLEELERDFNLMIDEWERKCREIPNLTQARNMDRYDLTGERLNSETRQELLGILMSRVRANRRA